jgi:RNA polymerase sigma factor (sigma-70 family)
VDGSTLHRWLRTGEPDARRDRRGSETGLRTPAGGSAGVWGGEGVIVSTPCRPLVPQASGRSPGVAAPPPLPEAPRPRRRPARRGPLPGPGRSDRPSARRRNLFGAPAYSPPESTGLSSLSLAAPLTWLPEVAPFGEETRSPSREAGRSAPLAGARDSERDRANAAMERYARGEDHAFSELYDSLAPRLRRYLLRASRDPGWADDLLQQTMLQIHRARGRFIVGAEVLPWAFAIARRLLIDGHRRRKNERRTISLETGGSEATPVEAAADQQGADELLGAAGPRAGGRARAAARESPGRLRAHPERGSVNPRGRRDPRRHAWRGQAARPSRL